MMLRARRIHSAQKATSEAVRSSERPGACDLNPMEEAALGGVES